MEKNYKTESKDPQKNNTQIRNSLSISFTSNRQFRIVNNNDKYLYDIENENSSEIKTSNIIKFIPVPDPIFELSKASNAIIKIEYNEFCGINQSNNLVHIFTKNKNDLNYLFRSEELLACSNYSFCEYIKNPLSFDIQHVESIDNKINTTKFATATKRCSFPCFCLYRPEIVVKNNNNDIYGKIVLPFSMGDTKYKIYDGNNKLKYTIDTDYCQPGILYPKNCCGYLPEVYFDIFGEKNEIDRIGTIERKPGEFKEFIYVLDCYQIFFPNNASSIDKFLLICSVIFIEYQIFKDKWGSLECCECDCDYEDCCANCGYRCCAELCTNCFRF